jgi:hypothetical protein
MRRVRCWHLFLSLLTATLARAAEQPVVYQGKITVAGEQSLLGYRVLALREPSAERPWDKEGSPVAFDGRFRVTAPPGACYLAFYLGRYLDDGSLTRVEGKAGDTVTDLEIAARPVRAVVTVALAKPNGSALGRSVRGHLCGAWGRYDASTLGVASDERGVLRFEKVPAGNYSLWVDTVSGQREAQPLAAQLFHGLEVTGGKHEQAIPLKLAPGGAVSGRLVSAGGQPAAGWLVNVQSGAVAHPAEAGAAAEWASGAVDSYAQIETDAQGAFRLAGLLPGAQTLDIRQPGESRVQHSVYVTIQAEQETDLGTVKLPATGWRHLFEGRGLEGWSQSDLFGRRDCRVEAGRVVVPTGDDMSGITWTGAALPKRNYEVTLQGMRVAGRDFWCGLTFPVGDDPCSLILGGWGGEVVGLSSIDGEDASQNGTSQTIEFEQQRWYRVRVRVTGDAILVWLDGKRIIAQELAGHRLSIRMEVEASKPLGVATWRTTGALRDIRLRPLPAP